MDQHDAASHVASNDNTSFALVVSACLSSTRIELATPGRPHPQDGTRLRASAPSLRKPYSSPDLANPASSSTAATRRMAPHEGKVRLPIEEGAPPSERTNRVLLELAERRPANEKALREIHRIGSKLAATHGRTLIMLRAGGRS